MNDLLARVKAEQGNIAVDTAQVLSQTAVDEFGYEIADPTALVPRVHKLVSKELGVDPDAALQEIELLEDEEDHMDIWSLTDHCVVTMNTQPDPGYDGAEKRSSVELTTSKVKMDMFEKAECVEHGWVTVNGR